MKILITGANGFIGRNLVARMNQIKGVELLLFDLAQSEADLEQGLSQAEVVCHLAGVNRPKEPEEFETGNAGLTLRICDILRRLGRTPKIIMSSSVQAELDNPYGVSKRRAEEALQAFSQERGAPVCVYRLKNVFGKWCRPNYNSVTATFCYNVAHDLPLTISDPLYALDLVYIDDIIDEFVKTIFFGNNHPEFIQSVDTIPSYRIALGDLAGRIQAFHEMRNSLVAPDFLDRFNQRLYATYLSYVEPEKLKYELEIKRDERGCLAEFIKSSSFGQIFISRTNPGITRGNHYHHTKSEKFFVITGEGLIRMRQVESGTVSEFRVGGNDFSVINIPPGYTHSIQNVGQNEMITLFWASEIFNPDLPDTYFQNV